MHFKAEVPMFLLLLVCHQDARFYCSSGFNVNHRLMARDHRKLVRDPKFHQVYLENGTTCPNEITCLNKKASLRQLMLINDILIHLFLFVHDSTKTANVTLCQRAAARDKCSPSVLVTTENVFRMNGDLPKDEMDFCIYGCN